MKLFLLPILPVALALCLGTMVMAGCGSGQDATASISPEAKAAVAHYRAYLERSATELVAASVPFAAVVEADKVHKSKALYPEAHALYARMTPVAKSFGDLDTRIDGHEEEVPEDEFGGFHLIERTLWYEGTAATMAPIAKHLLADIEELHQRVKSVNLQATEIASGASALLNETSSAMIDGTEELYGPTDLVDFEANVEGAEAAFEAVEPLLSKHDPKLAKEIEASFEDVYASLKPYISPTPYKHGDDFVPYGKLSKADKKKLAGKVEVLAEELSRVSAQIAD